jgi:hypothetical protein
MADGSVHPLHQIDIAALSAGVVAVSVSLFVAPGEYSLLNVMVSVVLVLVILGYVGGSIRTNTFQRLAVASVVGLACVPAIGFFDESLRFRDPVEGRQNLLSAQQLWTLKLKYLIGQELWDCNKDPCRPTNEHESRVTPGLLFLWWAGLSVVAFCVDTAVQQRRNRRSDMKETSN